MAWSATWSQSEFTNNDVKFLLADLCNAINERLGAIGSSKINWTTISGTSQTPTDSSFVGMQITQSSGSWYSVCGQIETGINTLFSTNKFYTDTDFDDTLTKAEALTNAGYVSNDTSASINWRNEVFYRSAKALLMQLRYGRINPNRTYSTITYYTTYDGIGGGYSTPTEAWDNATVFVQDVTNGVFQYELIAGYNEMPVKTDPDNTTITITLPTGASGSTVVKYQTTIASLIQTETGFIIDTINASFAGDSFNVTGSGTFDFEYTDDTPVLDLNLSVTPFSYDSPPPTVGESASIQIDVQSMAACCDFQPIFTYPST